MVAEQETFEEQLAKKVEAELAELRRAHEEKVQQIRAAFGDLRQQVTRLEAVAGPKARLTPEQLGQLRQTIATLGALLARARRGQTLPGHLHGYHPPDRRQPLGGYPPGRFESVIEFLENQIRALTRGGRLRPPVNRRRLARQPPEPSSV